MISETSKQLADSSEHLADKVSGITPTQQVNQQIVHALRSCNDMLSQFQATQEKMLPILAKLQEPIELRFVGAQKVRRARDGD